MVVEAKFRITYRAPYTTLLKKRDWNAQVETPSWTEVALFQKRRHLAKHFTEAGASEYGYARRSRDYTKKKEKKFGHRNPLEWTGELKRCIRSPEIRATAKGVKIVLRGSQKANLRNPKSKADMAAELRVISDAEAVRLAKQKDLEMLRRIRAARGTDTKTL